ncbi:exopolysaccharide transport family protein [Fulvivirga sp. M361]|uniref:exopolysaccharide transport family protein n=1 Tax=Fulvivirga sp. M361 TaxID=2594266 RepID=UPI00162979C8|nr:tyrosine-protein kinase family protein [Fulvivirga sp. M361]
MTILIKDQNEQDNSISDLIYNSRGFMPGKNYYNEEILLRSYPLIRKAVEKLDFNVSYYQEGDIKTSELYPGPPLKISVDSIHSQLPHGRSFYLNVVDSQSFEVRASDNKSENKGVKFGEWFDFQGIRYKIDALNEAKITSFQDELLVVFRSYSAVAGSYTGRINVNWLQEGASILSLTLNGPTPAKDADFLRRLAETYQERDLLTKNEQATRTVSFIDDQLAIISDSLVLLELEIQKFKENNFSSGISNEASRYQDNLDDLLGKQSELILEENYFNYLTNYLDGQEDLREITIPAAVGISNNLLNDLVKQLIDLQIENKQLLRTTKTDNPYLKEIQNRTDEIKSGIKEVINSLRQSLSIAQAELTRQINNAKFGLSALPKAEREYVNLNRLYKLSESLFLILMEKKAEASITRASNTSDVVIVNPPAFGGPITPKTSKNYIMALLIGLGLPIGLILLFDYFNDKVKFKEDVERYTDIPFLGVIGHNKDKANLVVHQSPRSAITESFRSVRSNINFFVGNGSSKTVLITSSIAGEGKTFCADNLALIFASTGKKTILIGADMRRPKLFRDFDISNELGLSNYLSSDIGVDEIVQTSPFENLHILNSGTIPPNPSELLLRDRLPELMAELKKAYDFIVIDSPPVGLVTDAMILAKYADHSIYIVRQGYTPVGTVKNADEMYRAGKMSNLSIIFNDVTVNKYGYGYGYSYKYGYTYGYGYSNGSGYYTNQSRTNSFLQKLRFKKRS